jgi:hypothetical protein
MEIDEDNEASGFENKANKKMWLIDENNGTSGVWDTAKKENWLIDEK